MKVYMITLLLSEAVHSFSRGRSQLRFSHQTLRRTQQHPRTAATRDDGQANTEGSILDLRITDLTNLGDGVGKVELGSSSSGGGGGGGQRYVVFVPGVVPGELVRVRVREHRKTHARADLVEVLEASPRRVEPNCALFGACGGCQYQHMSIDAQREMKRKQVATSLQRIGGFTLAPPPPTEILGGGGGVGGGDGLVVSPVVGSEEIYGYRTKLTPRYGGQSMDGGGGGGGGATGGVPIGFQAAKSTRSSGGVGGRDLIDVPLCPLATPQLNARLATHRAAVHESAAAAAAAAGRPRGTTQQAAVTSNKKKGKPQPQQQQQQQRRRRQQQQQQQQQQQGRRRRNGEYDEDEDEAGDTLLLRHALRLRDDEHQAAEDDDALVAAAVAGELRLEAHVATDPDECVFERVGHLTFKFKAGEFFQNNPFVLPKLVDHVVTQARAPLTAASGGESGRGAQREQPGQPGLRRATRLIDTYCGGGLFCLSAARHFERCAGIEISKRNVVSARGNAELNGVANCRFLEGSAEDIFAAVEKEDARTASRQVAKGKQEQQSGGSDSSPSSAFNPSSTVVVVDPPRRGCSPEFLEQLVAFRPARVVYVSCDPATQARDAKELVRCGYAVRDVTPFDLFPQTRHIENVMTFDLVSC